MASEQIAVLAASGEFAKQEFKSTTGTRPEVTASICAMLDQCGGRALLDKAPNGLVVGQKVSKR